MTPLGALAAAGIAVAAVLGLRRDGNPRGSDLSASPGDRPSATGEFAAVHAPPASLAPRDTVVVTRFVLVAPEAKQVTLVGDFNEWDRQATPLQRVAAPGSNHGVWTIELPLAAGRYSYAFLVDGQRWVADPTHPRVIGDDFGRPSSAVTVGGGTV